MGTEEAQPRFTEGCGPRNHGRHSLRGAPVGTLRRVLRSQIPPLHRAALRLTNGSSKTILRKATTCRKGLNSGCWAYHAWLRAMVRVALAYMDNSAAPSALCSCPACGSGI